MKLFNHSKAHVTPKHPSALKAVVQEIGSDPYVDWLIILVLATLISVSLIVAGVFIYLQVGNRLAESSTVVSQGRRLTIDEKMLRHVLEQFGERATEREKLLKGYTGTADPSI